MTKLFHRELHSPTGVLACDVGCVVRTGARELVVSRGTVLEVYRVISVDDGGAEDADAAGAQEVSGTLEVVAQFHLLAPIESMAVVSLPAQPRDALLLMFTEAKMSLVQYNEATNELDTLSLHSMENDVVRGLYSESVDRPAVIVDPQNVCAVSWVFGRSILVHPINTEAVLATRNADSVSTDIRLPGSKQWLLPSFLVSGEHFGNIRDIQFLHGYFEPTLAVLCEPKQTWSGRLPHRRDTCNVVVLSLSVSDRSHSTVWRVEHVPHDAFRLVPVPPPVGGVMVLTPNMMLWYSQSSSYGLSLNEFGVAPRRAQFRMEVSPVVVELGACQLDFLRPDQMLLSLRGGQLYVVNLIGDGLSVRSIKLAKVASSVLPSCLRVLDHRFLMIGSRVGDSLLIGYTHRNAPAAEAIKEELEAQAGDHIKQEEREDGAPAPGEGEAGEAGGGTQPQPAQASQPEEAEDDELMQLYETSGGAGGDAHAGRDGQGGVLHLTICDTLMNVAPVRDVTIGESCNADSTPCPPVNGVEQLDIVTASGDDKNGALVVMQQGVRPSVLASVDLPTCEQLWTVRYAPGGVARQAEQVHPHSFVVLDLADRVMVLKLSVSAEGGLEVNDVGKHALAQNRTVHVDSMFDCRCIVQVHTQGVLLLTNMHTVLQAVAAGGEGDARGPIVSACVEDMFVLLQHKSGALTLLTADEDTMTLHTTELTLSAMKDADGAVEGVTACALYYDEGTSPLFARKAEEGEDNAGAAGPGAGDVDMGGDGADAPREAGADEDLFLYGVEDDGGDDGGDGHGAGDVRMEEADDDDDDLYGGDGDEDDDTGAAGALGGRPGLDAVAGGSGGDGGDGVEDDDAPMQRDAKRQRLVEERREPATFLVVSRTNGVLEVYALPSQELVFSSTEFAAAPWLVTHKVWSAGMGVIRSLKVTELCITRAGTDDSAPYLLVRLNTGDMYVYRAFGYEDPAAAKGTLCLRLSRVGIEQLPAALWHERARAKKDGTEITQPLAYRSVTPFHNVAGMAGVFVSGPNPLWAFNDRNVLRVLPMTNAGHVLGFAPFLFSFGGDEVDHGMVYLDAKRTLHIAQLSDAVTYETGWGVRKIPFKCTVRRVAYHPDAKLYCVAVSRRVPYEELWQRKVEKDAIKRAKEMAEDQVPMRQQDVEIEPPKPLTDRAPPVWGDEFELQLVVPGLWNVIDSHTFADWEEVSDMRVATVGVGKRRSNYLIVGVSVLEGEDRQIKGRVELYDVLRQEEEGQVSGWLKEVSMFQPKGVMTGTCTAVHAMEGKVIASFAQKVLMFHLEEDGTLAPCAFWDGLQHTTSLSTLRNFATLGDWRNDMYLVRWRNNTRSLSLLARGHGQPRETSAVEFVINKRAVSVLTADVAGNVVEYSFFPQGVKSESQKIRAIADFHLGSAVHCLQRVPMAAHSYPVQTHRWFNLYATTGGALGAFAPISDDVYACLASLSDAMVHAMPHAAGLHPKESRTTRHGSAMVKERKNNVVDGELLFKFLLLDKVTQKKLAAAVVPPKKSASGGEAMRVTTDRIIAWIVELQRACSFT